MSPEPTGRIIVSPPPAPHQCVLPKAERMVDRETRLPATIAIPPGMFGAQVISESTGLPVEEEGASHDVVLETCVGSAWECDCGAVWVGEWVPPSENYRFVRMGFARWRPEKRRERKRRLKAARRARDSDISDSGENT